MKIKYVTELSMHMDSVRWALEDANNAIRQYMREKGKLGEEPDSYFVGQMCKIRDGLAVVVKAHTELDNELSILKCEVGKQK